MKKKILLIADVKDWAWDIKSHDIKYYLKDDFDIDIAYSREKDIKKVDFKKYDLIVCYWWQQQHQLRDLLPEDKKILLGVSSMFEFSGDLAEKFFTIAEMVDAVFVQNKDMLLQLKDKVTKPIFYCKNCVNTKNFYPQKEIGVDSKKLVVGFAGATYSAGNKGLYDIIIPAVKSLENVSIKFLDRAKEKHIPPAEMPHFFNEIDCYICASENEASPRPCLEAAACARPIITTRVGVMPEIVKHMKNSLFIERSIKDLKEKIRFYRDNRDKLIEHGKIMQREIKDNWSWDTQIGDYKKMFEDVIK